MPAGFPDGEGAVREKTAMDVLSEHGLGWLDDDRPTDLGNVWHVVRQAENDLRHLTVLRGAQDRDALTPRDEKTRASLAKESPVARAFFDQEEGADTSCPGCGTPHGSEHGRLCPVVESERHHPYAAPDDGKIHTIADIEEVIDNWQHRSDMMKCRTCMWYVPKRQRRSVREIGRCRQSSPTIKGWPAIYPDDWCGAHKLDEEKL